MTKFMVCFYHERRPMSGVFYLNENFSLEPYTIVLDILRELEIRDTVTDKMSNTGVGDCLDESLKNRLFRPLCLRQTLCKFSDL